MTLINPIIEFKPATIDDLTLLQYWDTKHHVIDCDGDFDWNWEVELKRDPPWREQLIALLGGEPIGFIQIINAHDEETHFWGEVEPNTMAIDIWIGEEENLNNGYGTTIMRMAIDRCFSDPKVNQILIDPLNSNTKAHRFYERLGFKFVEERQFGGTDCFVYLLSLNYWESIENNKS